MGLWNNSHGESQHPNPMGFLGISRGIQAAIPGEFLGFPGGHCLNPSPVEDLSCQDLQFPAGISGIQGHSRNSRATPSLRYSDFWEFSFPTPQEPRKLREFSGMLLPVPEILGIRAHPWGSSLFFFPVFSRVLYSRFFLFSRFFPRKGRALPLVPHFPIKNFPFPRKSRFGFFFFPGVWIWGWNCGKNLWNSRNSLLSWVNPKFSRNSWC